MAGRPPSGPLTLADCLDIVVLGFIVLPIGVSLLLPVEVGTVAAAGGPMERNLVLTARALAALSGPEKTLGVFLTLVGCVMILLGPLWVLVGQPLSRRGYL